MSLSRHLGAPLETLVDTELVGSLLDGEDGGAGGDAGGEGGGAGGGEGGVVRGVVRVLLLFLMVVVVPGVRVRKTTTATRVVSIVRKTTSFVLILVKVRRLNDPSR